MPFFDNCQLELWEPIKINEYNDYGEQIINHVLIDTVPADFQPLSPESSIRMFGKILQDTYKVYLNMNVNVTDKTICRIVGESTTYELIGSPMTNNNLLHHKKILIRKQRKTTTL